MSSESTTHIQAQSPAIQANNLSKTYHIYKSPSDRLKQLIWGHKKTYYEPYHALKNISFDLPKGEVLGIVGRNGAGKSTLLQLLCKTLTPSSGDLKINGRIAALLELGAGFNPLFTGRENIYLSATVMGITHQEIDQKLEGIIDFSGIRPFIDQPVTTYSSGMYVRLAFSVATSVDPDILIIDEALSVGDGDFARRSFERIMEMRDSGKTILFCSHSLYQVEALCTHTIWIEKGEIRASGKPDVVIPDYQSFLDRLGNHAPLPEQSTTQSSESAPIPDAPLTAHKTEQEENESHAGQAPSTNRAKITKVLAHADGITGNVLNISSGTSNLTIEVEFHSSLINEIPGVALVIHSAGGQLVTSCGTWADNLTPDLDANGQGHLSISFKDLPLMKGTYYVGVLLFCNRGIFLHDEADPAITLHVTQSGQERGLVYIPHQWEQLKKKPRWQVAKVSDIPEADITELFQEAFDHPLDLEMWRWKYSLSSTPGTAITENGKLIAFNGGTPRQGLIFGQPENLVQLGDIMVSKKARGILTKKGPFQLAVSHFLEQNIGPDKLYSLGFGFPNIRAFKVGLKQNLYCPIDKIIDVSWASTSPLEQQNFSIEEIDTKSADLTSALTEIDTLWQCMKEDTTDIAIGSRDSHWIKHRYIDKPNADYLLYFIKGDAAKGLLILKQHPNNEIELLDIIAPHKQANNLIMAAKIIAQSKNCGRIYAWCTPSSLAWFKESKPSVKETDIIIPGSNVNNPSHAMRIKGKWWLLGGDTDFR